MKFCPRCGHFVNGKKHCPKCEYYSINTSHSRISGSKTGIICSLIIIVITVIVFTTFPSADNSNNSQLVNSDVDFDMPLDINAPVKYNDQLMQFALEQVNNDRKKYGVQPVELGNNLAAQKHVDDMLEFGYFSHWNSEGVKPYVTYTLFGGRGNVAENISYTFSQCATSNCIPMIFDPFKEIEDHQYGMMYDDAISNWGHRDTIIDPDYTHVNFGITYDEDNFYFAQHFETNIIEWKKFELVDSQLEMAGKLPDNFSTMQIHIYADKNSKSLSGKTLDEEYPYNQNHYDRGELVGMFLEPLPINTSYDECEMGKIIVTGEFGIKNCIDYKIFYNNHIDPDEFNISIDISKWLESEELHTMYVMLNNEKNELVDAASITLEYLK